MKKNKVSMIIAIIVSVTIITIGSVMIIQIVKNDQASKLVIEKCFDNFDSKGSVVVEKDNFWSPVTCENE